MFAIKSTKTDRRVKYTKHALTEALVALLAENHISKISVTMLCREADINRSTFYVHYQDQLDLLRDVEQRVYENIEGLIHTERRSTNALKQILEYTAQNSLLCQALLNANSDSKFFERIMRLVALEIEGTQTAIDERALEYVRLFTVTSCISVIRKWLDDGMIESVDEMTELIMRLLNMGASRVIHEDRQGEFCIH